MPGPRPMRILGVDEAGRGPVLGPLVMGAVLADDAKLEVLREIGVKDSKALTRKARERIFERLAQSFVSGYELVTPDDINRPDSNLNRLEYDALCRLILKFRPDQLYVDAFANPARLVRDLVGTFPSLTVVAEWKADENYPIVSAASIVAKVIRDRHIDGLKKEHGELGSGYPGDPKTVRWLRSQILKNRLATGSLPSIVRLRWSTVRRIAEDSACPPGPADV